MSAICLRNSLIIRESVGLQLSKAAALSSVRKFEHKTFQNLHRYVELLRDRKFRHIAPVTVETHKTELFKALHNLWYTICLTGSLGDTLEDLKSPPILKDITATKMDSAKLMESS